MKLLPKNVDLILRNEGVPISNVFIHSIFIFISYTHCTQEKESIETIVTLLARQSDNFSLIRCCVLFTTQYVSVPLVNIFAIFAGKKCRALRNRFLKCPWLELFEKKLKLPFYRHRSTYRSHFTL